MLFIISNYPLQQWTRIMISFMSLQFGPCLLSICHALPRSWSTYPPQSPTCLVPRIVFIMIGIFRGYGYKFLLVSCNRLAIYFVFITFTDLSPYILALRGYFGWYLNTNDVMLIKFIAHKTLTDLCSHKKSSVCFNLCFYTHSL